MPQHSSHRRPRGQGRPPRSVSGARETYGEHRGRHEGEARRTNRGERRRYDGAGGSDGRGSGLSGTLRNLGWRAYIIPLLLVVTVWVLVDLVRDGETGETTATGPRSSSSDTPIPTGEWDMELADLPPGPDFAVEGSGTFVPVGVPGDRIGVGEELLVRYSIEIEDVVDTSTFGGADAFASMIDATLGDPRGWTDNPAFAFQHVSSDDAPDTLIRLVSTDTARQMCGAEQFQMEVSCRLSPLSDSEPDQVILNNARWVRGAVPFQGDLGMYRQYLVNHEMGHRLGFAGHEPCPGDGALAPLMMQQTLSLSNSEIHEMNPDEVYPDDGAVCVANSWPYPMAGSGG